MKLTIKRFILLLAATNSNNMTEEIEPIIEEKQQRDLKMEQALKAAARL